MINSLNKEMPRRLIKFMKRCSYISFLILLLATMFNDGNSGRWLECIVDSVALAMIIKKD